MHANRLFPSSGYDEAMRMFNYPEGKTVWLFFQRGNRTRAARGPDPEAFEKHPSILKSENATSSLEALKRTAAGSVDAIHIVTRY